jgi:hypothetical protein
MQLRRLSRTAVISVSLLLALVAGPARADKSSDARALFESGNTHFAVGEFEAAGEKYQEAYKLKPDAALLYNAAQAFRLAGKVERALVLYKNYVLFYPKARNIDEVRKVIVSLEEARSSVEKAKTAPPVDTAQVGSDKPARTSQKPERVAASTTTTTTTTTQPRAATATTTPPQPATTAPPPDDGGGTSAPTTTTTTAPTTTTATTAQAETTKPRDTTPVYKKWWLWTIVGGVVVVGVGVGVGVAVSQKGEPWATNPQIGPGAALLQVSW